MSGPLNTSPDFSLDASLSNSSAIPAENPRIQDLYQKLAQHVDQAKSVIRKTVDTQMVKAYWLMGRDIVEEEQSGEQRAGYGQFVLQSLSQKLTKKYGRGFSVDTLERIRKFYIAYESYQGFQEISAPLVRKSHSEISEMAFRKLEPPQFSKNLSWAHYLLLIQVKREEARNFYEIEAEKNNWTKRELQRQISSFLFERLEKTKKKNKITNTSLELENFGHEITQASDSIKDPFVFDFLDLPYPGKKLKESTLETALIDHLQDFLLELGRGFSFLARQKRLTLEGDHFYADLVMYHVILKCYVIIDLKTNALSYGDLGQMQLYVNYFDQKIKMANDNPTIGLVLCTQKNDTMVKYTLGDNAKQIFASNYQFHLPTEEELTKEIQRELDELNFKNNLNHQEPSHV